MLFCSSDCFTWWSWLYISFFQHAWPVWLICNYCILLKSHQKAPHPRRWELMALRWLWRWWRRRGWWWWWWWRRRWRWRWLTIPVQILFIRNGFQSYAISFNQIDWFKEQTLASKSDSSNVDPNALKIATGKKISIDDNASGFTDPTTAPCPFSSCEDPGSRTPGSTDATFPDRTPDTNIWSLTWQVSNSRNS